MNQEQPNSWNGKSKANGLAFRIFLFVLENSGITGAYIFLYFVASYFFWFDRKSNRYSRYYFRELLGYSRWKTFVYRYKNYYRFGQTVLDKVAMISGMKSKFNINFDGHSMLEQMAKEDKGGILISAHIGNWEVAGHFLKNANRPVNVIMLDEEHEAIKAVLKKSIANRAFKVITVKSDFSHLLDIKRAIDNKEFICIHGDRAQQHARGKVKILKFLGKDVQIPRGPFDLAKRFGVPVLFVFAMKSGRRDYHFRAFQPRPSFGHTTDDIISDYVDRMEEVLRPYPEQWFNFYDYWGIDHPFSIPPTRARKANEKEVSAAS